MPENDWPLTPEIEWNMMRVHQQHLSTEYDNVRYILTLQEREIAVQTLIIGLLVFALIRTHHKVQWLIEKETHGSAG